ncbi:MAG: hypothetical protein KDD66_05320 [Bdellovibrionales bacterium]|nr:hypothetical protein [Bdellovibrionales bacterium]
MDINEYKIEDLSEGLEESIEMLITEELLDAFIEISGDRSPIHCDTEFAKQQGFSGRVVHGQLLGAGVSRLVGTRLPGRYAVLQSIEIGFRAPCYAPERVIVSGVVDSVSESVGQVTLKVTIRGEDQRLLAKGTAKALVRT